MEFYSTLSDHQSAQGSGGKGRDNASKKGIPPGFNNASRETSRAFQSLNLGGPMATSSSSASTGFDDAFPNIGSSLGGPNTGLNALKDDFDSFLDETASETAPIGGIARPFDSQPIATFGGKMGGFFLPYLPQDDAVAAGLGVKEGGIDASEAQEVVDVLNQQLAALLRCSPAQFWKQVAMDESLDTFIDSYLHFRRRWYDGKPFANGGGQTAGVIVGDGDLSRRVFMLLYRMSSNQDPGVPASESLSAKEHTALLKEWRLLDLPKLLDICAVYDHDNHELTTRLVSNVFRAQPSFADDLVGMVRPILRKIDTMHQRCCTLIDSLQETEVGGVQEQFTEVVEYLNDVIITLDSFVGAYPPAASILISAGHSRNGIGLFLPTIGAIYDSMLPVLSTGVTALANPPPSSYEKEDTEVVAQIQLKRLKAGIVNFVWKLLHTCFLEEKETEVSSIRNYPSLGATSQMITALEDPAVKGDMLVQAASALSTGLGETDADGSPVYLGATSQTFSKGALLRSLEKRHGLCEKIHELCQTGALVMYDTQYNSILSLIAPGHTLKFSDSSQPLITNDKDNGEEAIMLQSKISQVKDLFPDYGDGFVTLCLEAYDNDPEKVISQILEGTLHSDLASLDVSLATKPSSTTGTPRDKGKGKVTEAVNHRNTSAGHPSVLSHGSVAGGASTGSSSGRPPAAFASGTENVKSQSTSSNQGRFIRRGKEAGTFNDLINRREDRAYSATVRAGKQYEYEDEYDDSFDDLAGTYLADVGEEETENLADRAKRRSVPSISYEGSDVRPSSKKLGPSSGRGGGLHQMVPGGPDQISDRRHNRQQDIPRGSSTALLPNPADSHYTPSVAARGGHSTGQRGKPTEGRRSAPVTPQTSSLARVAPTPTEENGLAAPGGPSEQSRSSTSQGPTGAGRGGKSRRGKGKPEASANFYLKDGKLYSYKVTGAEASFATVEEYEASNREEEETIFGLRAGGNVPVANVDERDSPGNLEQGPSGRGSGGRGRGGPPGRGRYPSKSHDNHRRKDQSMKKHFAGLGGL